jgi:hypothetical protein
LYNADLVTANDHFLDIFYKSKKLDFKLAKRAIYEKEYNMCIFWLMLLGGSCVDAQVMKKNSLFSKRSKNENKANSYFRFCQNENKGCSVDLS